MSQVKTRKTNVAGLVLAGEPRQVAIVHEKSGRRVLPLLADSDERASWLAEQLGRITKWDGDVALDEGQRRRLGALYHDLAAPRIAAGWTYDPGKPTIADR